MQWLTKYENKGILSSISSFSSALSLSVEKEKILVSSEQYINFFFRFTKVDFQQEALNKFQFCMLYKNNIYYLMSTVKFQRFAVPVHNRIRKCVAVSTKDGCLIIGNITSSNKKGFVDLK
uniref:Uncharacterized protein n=1 Tax=Onchocerca volvulus TaxID=6282 RepID=A0A8R1TSP7_ONCVO